MFDDQHLLPVDRGRIIEGLRDFITRLAPSDWMAIVSLGRTSRTLVPFTNSKESLLDGLTRLEKMAPPGLAWDSQFRLQVNEIRRSNPRSRSSLVRTWAEQVRAREDGSLQDLQRAVSALAARSGKRTLIFVSRGFELHPGQTLFAAIGPGINKFDYSVADAWQKVIDEANRGGVTIHALDGRGLVAEADASESAPPLVSAFLDNQTRRETLAGLAEETGGTLVFERNFFPAALDQIYRDSGSYYLVGVTLTSLDPKKATHDVKVTSTRPGVKVRARKRYAPMSADGAARNRAEMALITPDATGEFPIAV
ncbi:MAG TPA: VWA domain-containing protein [Thermoanaerobaculia bacterium]